MHVRTLIQLCTDALHQINNARKPNRRRVRISRFQDEYSIQQLERRTLLTAP